ncbi:hypothetical protein ZIOFF_073108 [Zingiber officinale]|uniref:Uncharacterized protein n=1 Tax=Zingiber officinale TaxID=94328 RepID=A0A8J5BVN1_ZINOF|nr:hypothetical protein ZIOFF_073108 [Zingiber officinale]
MIGSSLPPNPSSRNLLSSSSTKDFGSRSLPAFLVENGNLGLSWNLGNQTVGVSSKTEGEVGANSINCLSPQSKLFGDSKSSSIGGLAQRMTTRKGFNVPKLDTANIPSTSTISSLEIPLPYLTIPPGLSPTALFESPALFSDISLQANETGLQVEMYFPNHEEQEEDLHVPAELIMKAEVKQVQHAVQALTSRILEGQAMELQSMSCRMINFIQVDPKMGQLAAKEWNIMMQHVPSQIPY